MLLVLPDIIIEFLLFLILGYLIVCPTNAMTLGPRIYIYLVHHFLIPITAKFRGLSS